MARGGQLDPAASTETARLHRKRKSNARPALALNRAAMGWLFAGRGLTGRGGRRPRRRNGGERVPGSAGGRQVEGERELVAGIEAGGDRPERPLPGVRQAGEQQQTRQAGQRQKPNPVPGRRRRPPQQEAQAARHGQNGQALEPGVKEQRGESGVLKVTRRWFESTHSCQRPSFRACSMVCCKSCNSESDSRVSAVSSRAAMACVTEPWKKVETTRFNAERRAVSREARGR